MGFTTIRQAIDYFANKTPHQIFILDPENNVEITYKKLQQDIRKMSGFFDNYQFTLDDRLGFFLDNSYAACLVFLSAIYNGLTIVPINVVSGEQQIKHVLQHADCKAIIASEKYYQNFNNTLSNCTSEVIIFRNLQDVNFGGKNYRNTVNENTRALIIYTSGTTGLPKGVVLTNKNIIAGATNTIIAHKIQPSDRALCVLPLYHINAEIVTLIAPLISGSSVVMLNKFSVSNFWCILSEYKCTWFSVVPTIINYLLNDDADLQKFNLTNIRFGRSASAPLSPISHKKFEQRFGISIVETMGLSETAAQILSNPLNKFKYGSPGIAFGNKAKIINSDGSDAKVDEIGELIIKGDNVMLEYFKNQEATTSTFTQDGWLLTGDLAKQDEDGYFFIMGRKKELIIKGGENISPREIDEVVNEHRAILEACAFGVKDNFYGEEIAVCVFVKSGHTVSEDEIKNFCLAKLGKFKMPSKVFYSEKPLPKGPSGKIQRLKIAAKHR